MLYLLVAIAGAMTSLFFDWLLVFLLSLLIWLVATGVLLHRGVDWWTLARVWLATAVFHLSYFCFGLFWFYLRTKLAKQEHDATRSGHNGKS